MPASSARLKARVPICACRAASWPATQAAPKPGTVNASCVAIQARPVRPRDSGTAKLCTSGSPSKRAARPTSGISRISCTRAISMPFRERSTDRQRQTPRTAQCALLRVFAHQIVDIDRTADLERGVVVAQHLEHLAAPVRGLLLAALERPFGRVGSGAFLNQSPEKLDVEPVLRALDGAVVQLAGGQSVELLEGGHEPEVIRVAGAPNR